MTRIYNYIIKEAVKYPIYDHCSYCVYHANGDDDFFDASRNI